MTDVYMATNGNDSWSGFLAEPNAEGTDGPLATLDAARKHVRSLRHRNLLVGPVTVWIRGGRYPLNAPVCFGPEDSGPTTYAAYKDETPVFDGAIRITDLAEETVNGVKTWTADVSTVIDRWGCFRSLFVDGERRPRARWPKNDWLWIEGVPDFSTELFEGRDTFIAAEGDFREWTNLTDCEVVATHYWIEERMPVVGYDPVTRKVHSSRRSMFSLRNDYAEGFARYFVENVFEELKEPGEWYLHGIEKKLYYVPKEGERLGETKLVIPHVLQFLRITGDVAVGTFVHGIHLKGLTFEYTDWVQPTGWGKWYDPYRPEAEWRSRDSFLHFTNADPSNRNILGMEFAAVPQGAFNVPGVVFLEAATQCIVEDCRISHVGWNGIDIGEGCCENVIIGNTITDMGAGGVKMDGAEDFDSPNRYTGRNRITDNHIHMGGCVFFSAIGIHILHSGRNVIAHNEIHDLYYSGISVGWEWGFKDTTARDNQIIKNHIYQIGQGILSDMGGIYTLGVQPGTVIRGNVIHDVDRLNYGGEGIYLDAGSSCMVVEDNIIYDVRDQAMLENGGRQNIIRNNIFAFGSEGNIARTRKDDQEWIDWPKNGSNFERNIVVSRGGAGYKDYNLSLESQTLTSMLNLFWDYDSPAPVVWNFVPWEKFNREHRKYSLEEIQAMGLETGSVADDPCFEDPGKRDFTLSDNSPALKLGFKPIDITAAGIRR